MGIDVCMSWKGQTEQEKKAQEIFNVACGHTGYLREAYHGEPYATKILVPEAFKSQVCEAQILAKLLRERLPAALKASLKRERDVYQREQVNEDTPSVKSVIDFVELAERKELETGEPVTIWVSY